MALMKFRVVASKHDWKTGHASEETWNYAARDLALARVTILMTSWAGSDVTEEAPDSKGVTVFRIAPAAAPA